MNDIIYKYDLSLKPGRQIVRLPRGAKPLSVAFQQEHSGVGDPAPKLRVWAVVGPDIAAKFTKNPSSGGYADLFTFLVMATGSPDHIGGLNYLGRADTGGLVFHVFGCLGEHLGEHP
jgi:hypothetical protein